MPSSLSKHTFMDFNCNDIKREGVTDKCSVMAQSRRLAMYPVQGIMLQGSSSKRCYLLPKKDERGGHTHMHTHTQTHILNNNLLFSLAFFSCLSFNSALHFVTLRYNQRRQRSGCNESVKPMYMYIIGDKHYRGPPTFQETLPSLIWCLNDNEHSHDNLYHQIFFFKESDACTYSHIPCKSNSST